MTFMSSAARCANINDVAPILTRCHELDHYRAYASTPFGVFIYRILQLAQADTQQTAAIIADQLGSVYSVQGPMLEWYRNKGHKLVSPKAEVGPGKPLRDYLDFMLKEVTYLRHLAQEFLTSSGHDKVRSCKIMNALFLIFKFRHGLDSTREDKLCGEPIIAKVCDITCLQDKVRRGLMQQK